MSGAHRAGSGRGLLGSKRRVPLPALRPSDGPRRRRAGVAVREVQQDGRGRLHDGLADVLDPHGEVVLDLLHVRLHLGVVQLRPVIRQLGEVPDHNQIVHQEVVPALVTNENHGSPVVGCIGAGNFAKRILFQSLKKTLSRLKMVATLNPVTSTLSAKKFGFEYSSVDYGKILEDSEINTVFITTRHDSHAKLVAESLEAGKNVFVEKPLAMTLGELDKIQSLMLKNKSSILMVGFNRRFAPHILKIKTLLNERKQPKSFIITVNAGAIPPDHWTQDPEVGGGRIIGEACHFIDLMRFLSDSPINEWSAQCMGNDTLKDKVTINIKFKDESFGSIHYLANGSKRFPKERIEIFCGGSIIQLDNFRKMKGYSWPGFKKMKLRWQDKGHEAEVNAFVEAVKNGNPSPIPFEELIEISRTTIKIANTL